MASHTQHNTPMFEPPKNTQTPQTAEWLYDEIMRFIEPDLMLKSIPTLKKKYKKETAEQKQQRMEAYEFSFKLFDEAYAFVTDLMETGVQQLRNATRKSVHEQEEQERAQAIKRAESSLDSPHS